MACYSHQVNCAGKVVLITGASEGIGLACAEALRARGAQVVGVARNEAKLRAIAGLHAIPGDLTEPGFAAHAVAETVSRCGRLDILINNAGIGLYAPSWQASLDDTRRMFELNLMAPLALTQAAVPHMRAQGAGLIVNVGSIAGKMTLPWLTLYSASKYALGSFTDGLRLELAGSGVGAMLVCPGYVSTGFQSHVLGGRPPAKIFHARGMAITPEQCAAAIVRGIERGSRTVLTPSLGWALVAAARLLPRIVDAQLRRLNESHSA
ncbi:MAG: SDR family NAD(P)-dependent oxidoreductase [Bryobacteraceae bacterium]|nr:SDR family NAD(P)-dependent oxidoreductase [Bryobacteraceae bacterium]